MTYMFCYFLTFIFDCDFDQVHVYSKVFMLVVILYKMDV